jgi:hypothetical protein
MTEYTTTSRLRSAFDFPRNELDLSVPRDILIMMLQNCDMLLTSTDRRLSALRGMCEDLVCCGVYNAAELQRLLNDAPGHPSPYVGGLLRSLLQRF